MSGSVGFGPVAHGPLDSARLGNNKNVGKNPARPEPTRPDAQEVSAKACIDPHSNRDPINLMSLTTTLTLPVSGSNAAKRRLGALHCGQT